MCKESVLWQVLRTLSEPFLSVPYSPENSQSLLMHTGEMHIFLKPPLFIHIWPMKNIFI